MEEIPLKMGQRALKSPDRGGMGMGIENRERVGCLHAEESSEERGNIL